jgi:hypothetical protein
MTSTSLPLPTFSDSKRFFADSGYRGQCAERAVEVIFDLENYRGTQRLYIP